MGLLLGLSLLPEPSPVGKDRQLVANTAIQERTASDDLLIIEYIPLFQYSWNEHEEHALLPMTFIFKTSG
jgi:hypothetical protein